jgi:hypothetical protein
MSAQIICSGLAQAGHAGDQFADHNGGSRVDQQHKSITLRGLAFGESVRGKGVER